MLMRRPNFIYLDFLFILTILGLSKEKSYLHVDQLDPSSVGSCSMLQKSKLYKQFSDLNFGKLFCN